MGVEKEGGGGLSDQVVEGTVKFGGGSLMLWECIMWEEIGHATKINTKMDAQLYVEILKDELAGSIEY